MLTISLMAAFVLAIALLAPVHAATVWNFADDFSTTQNPNGAWSYGWVSSLGGSMGLYNQINRLSTGVPEWRYGTDDALPHGMLCKNITGAVVPDNYSSQYWEAGMAGLHPGSGGDIATARWTASSTVLVTVSAVFSGLSWAGGGTTTDVHVLRNGVSLFDGTVDGFVGRAAQGYSDAFGPSPTQSFSTTMTVTAGDTLDFCVGFGNGSYAHDITGLAATVSARDDVGLLTGTVRSSLPGNPVLPGAIVKLADGSASVSAGADGKYSLLLPLGAQQVQVTYPGLREATAQMEITGGTTVVRDFTLTPDYGPVYFVSPTGDDSADGRSPSTAWRSISNGDASGVVAPGDTVIVAEGSYPQSDYRGVQLSLSGQPDLPITYKAVGHVVIDQTGIAKPTSTSYGFLISGHHVVIDGFEIMGSQWGICLDSGSHDNVIAGCTIHGLQPGDPASSELAGQCGGVYISSSSGNLIHHNLIYNVGAPGGPAAACVMIGGPSTGNSIYNNTLANAWAGVHAWDNAGNNSALDIRNNIVTGMRDHGIDFGQSTGCIGSYNLFFANALDYGEGAAPGEGDLIADPLFTAGYSLQANSPAIDAGVSVGLPFLGTAPDIGAFEYVNQTASKIGYTRMLADGQPVHLFEAKAVTAASLTFSDGSFYIEEPDRASGIRVLPMQGLPPVALGDRVTLRGNVATEASGERVINAYAIDSQSTGTPLKPLGLTGKAVAAKAGLNPRGLLVRTSGWVTYSAPDGSYAYVDDGSGAQDGSGRVGVRVAISGLVMQPLTAPVRDQFVLVTGVLGAFKDGSTTGPLLRPRVASDLEILPVLPSETTKRQHWADDNLSESAAAPPFSFTYNGQPSSELLASWDRTYSESRLDDKGTQRTMTYTDPATGLEVKCVSVEYDAYPTLEWTVYLTNTGSADTPIIENLQALDANLSIGVTDSVLHYNIGSLAQQNDYQPLDASLANGASVKLGASGGRPSESYLPYVNIEAEGSGAILAIGWPGQWAAQFTGRPNGAVGITAGQELTSFKLHPGEEVRTPLIALQFYNGDRARSQNVWRRWMLDHNVPRPGGEPIPPRLSTMTWFSTPSYGISNTATELYFMNRLISAGIYPDVWWVDAGWYQCPGDWVNTGTWEIDYSRYPNGLVEVFDQGHTYGMRSMVWFEPERVTPGSWLATEHQSWLLGSPGGWQLLDLGNADAWNWVVNHIDGMMASQHIDDYRQDFNISPLPYWQSRDAADRRGITEIKYVMGYLAFWDELRARHPGMLIDSCASGGRRNDLETLRRAVPLWRTDYTFEPVGTQGVTYGISPWMPYNGTGFQSTDTYTFRSNMALSSCSCIDLSNASLDMAKLKTLCDQWSTIMPYRFGDYYPLTPYNLAANSWMAWQFDLPVEGKGVVQAFRRSYSATASLLVKLSGLDPNATYTVTNIDGGSPLTKTGQSLMQTGLMINPGYAPAAVVVFYERN